VFQLVTTAAVGYAGWRLLGHTPYRIDIDVYRMGGQAWLDGRPLYAEDTLFQTPSGLNLPFTYPPLAAIVFCPFAWLQLPAASTTITLITFALLIVSTVIVLTRLDVGGRSAPVPDPAWARRCWLAAAIVAPATIWFEPIASNFAFGQINVVLMALVIADCVPRRTPWPRGLLLGLAIALKLTPAVFVLYLLLRRDGRALLTTVASFAAATLAGVVLAWRDSWEYWTNTVRHTDRIGGAALNTNQNLAGMLARVSLGGQERLALWAAAGLVVLVVTVWATRRVLCAGEPALGLICVALFGLVVSPVSWSHHWVWMLPAVLVSGVLAYRRRLVGLGVLSAAGVALMVWTPIRLLPEHHEATASWWRQLAGVSYLWWALALIITAGVTATAAVVSRSPATTPPPTVSASQLTASG
jgi:alpha-1,2-mannosyltransferase